MNFTSKDLRKCNNCGSMNNGKLSNCHECGNSLKSMKTDFIGSIVKKRFVTDETKGSESYWNCNTCGESNRSSNFYCHNCQEHHSKKAGSKGLFNSIADKVMDKAQQQGLNNNFLSEEMKDKIAEKASDIIVKGLSKIFKK